MEELNRLGFVPSDESAPWREAFPELEQNESGVMLRGARTKEGLTQRELAERSSIPQRHISEMENGKRPIGKERAKKLASVLDVSYKVFL
jgi:plasmid maintenance system antidote protein VapI